MWPRITTYFLNGIVVLLPFFVTIYLLRFIFNFMDGILGEIIAIFSGRHMPGLGVLATIGIVLIAGYLGTHVFGKKVIQIIELGLLKIPVVRNIYRAAKQINDVLFQNGPHREYRRPCVVEYPRPGIYSIGFMTSEVAPELGLSAELDLVNIFIPNTPTPATGFLIMVPKKDILPLAIGFDEAFKLVVSAGVLKPRGAAAATPPPIEPAGPLS